MAYHKIKFSSTKDPKVTRVGGLPLIADASDWPRFPKTGKPLLLLMSLSGDFLTPEFPDCKIPEGHCISVFCVFDPRDYDTTIALQMNDNQDLPNLAKGGSLVLLHPTANVPCQAPEGAPPEIPMKQMTLEAVADGDDQSREEGNHAGDVENKVGGMPGWAQEAIKLEGLRYVLQLNEGFLPKGKNPHAGIFDHETAFLMLSEKLTPGKAGILILQTA